VLALAALNVWRKPLPQVLKENLMDQIGASHAWRWFGYENSFVVMDGAIVQSVSGGGHWGGGMFIRRATWRGSAARGEERKMARPPDLSENLSARRARDRRAADLRVYELVSEHR
jgi:hypothetical protein